MFRSPAIPIVLSIAGTLTADVGQATALQQHSQEVAFSSGQLLELSFPDGGSAVVTGWDKPIASVRYSNRAGAIEDFHVKLLELPGGLHLSAEWKRRGSLDRDFVCEIRVPRRLDIEFHAGRGNLTLEDVEGHFAGETMGGSFTLRNVTGSVALVSMGGEIELVDSRLDGEISTGGGEVLLENIVGLIDASSGGGTVRYRNVREEHGRIRGPGGSYVPDADEKCIFMSTAGGDLEVTAAPSGAVLETAGGRITVGDSSRFVSADSGGGDIEIRIREGWVKAWTGAGDIAVDMRTGLGPSGRGIDLLSGIGDVSLTLPRGLVVALDLEIAYTRNSSRDYEILSDLELEIEAPRDWSHDGSTVRRYIRGFAGREGDAPLVKIRTQNGNIRILTAD